MNFDSLAIYFYTFIHVLPLDMVFLFIFRKRLRFSWQAVVGGYVLLTCCEAVLQTREGVPYSQKLAALFQLLYLGYDLGVIKDYLPRVLSIGFLTVPLELLAYSFAEYFCLQAGLYSSFFVAGLIIALLFAIFLLPILTYIRRDLEPLLLLQNDQSWLYLCIYELVMILMTLLVDPFDVVGSLRPLFARLLLFGNNICCFYLMIYLCKKIQAREYSSQVLNTLQALYAMERKKYEVIMEAWLRSRRLRHDLKHHLLSINTFLKQKNYTGLQEYLRQTLQELQTSEEKEGQKQV